MSRKALRSVGARAVPRAASALAFGLAFACGTGEPVPPRAGLADCWSLESIEGAALPVQIDPFTVVTWGGLVVTPTGLGQQLLRQQTVTRAGQSPSPGEIVDAAVVLGIDSDSLTFIIGPSPPGEIEGGSLMGEELEIHFQRNPDPSITGTWRYRREHEDSNVFGQYLCVPP